MTRRDAEWRRPLVFALVFVVAGVGSACGSTYRVDASSPPIARVWRARCGACHTPVEPGSRTRQEAATALARHHKRVALRDEEWAALVDFISGAAAPASRDDTPLGPAPSPAATGGADAGPDLGDGR